MFHFFLTTGIASVRIPQIPFGPCSLSRDQLDQIIGQKNPFLAAHDRVVSVLPPPLELEPPIHLQASYAHWPLISPGAVPLQLASGELRLRRKTQFIAFLSCLLNAFCVY